MGRLDRHPSQASLGSASHSSWNPDRIPIGFLIDFAIASMIARPSISVSIWGSPSPLQSVHTQRNRCLQTMSLSLKRKSVRQWPPSGDAKTSVSLRPRCFFPLSCAQVACPTLCPTNLAKEVIGGRPVFRPRGRIFGRHAGQRELPEVVCRGFLSAANRRHAPCSDRPPPSRRWPCQN